MEILAPAGDKAMLRAAVFSGADCIYLGVKGFNARSGAANFGEEENSIAKAVAFCHARNCKVYAAVNTLSKQGNSSNLMQAVQSAKDAGCDAIIVQDLQTAAIAKKIGGLPIHASTQMSVHSLRGVQQLADMGFSRVILSRELSKEEIAYIAKYSPIELEIFVHGALCVSVSGQCYMSAFLGGKQGKGGIRGANAGSCASPCRLPFKVTDLNSEFCKNSCRYESPAIDDFALSLKDLSVLDDLQDIEKMGISSVKIEGRLRGPEYCAAVVDAAKKSLAGQEYDKSFLQNVFSRSGFTNGWYKPVKASCKGGIDTQNMFGRRTAQDSANSKKHLPMARELYRREMQRVKITIKLVAADNAVKLEVNDGANIVEKAEHVILEKAMVSQKDLIINSLKKTGGTPFTPGDEIIVEDNGFYIPAGVISKLRRSALDELLSVRENAEYDVKQDVNAIKQAKMVQNIVNKPRVAEGETKKELLLRAEFLKFSQMPNNAPEICEELIFPLGEYKAIPEELKAKTRLYLPRVLFGEEENKAEKMVEDALNAGFNAFEAQNIAHFKILEKAGNISCGFGLNISNSAALYEYAKLGLQTATLSIELSMHEIANICNDVETKNVVASNILVYGYLPLMITRSCPVKAYKTNCNGRAALVDRTGASFPLICDKGVRNIYNSVPLWYLDKLNDVPCNYATLMFTVESRKNAGQIINAAKNCEVARTKFTRGFY